MKAARKTDKNAFDGSLQTKGAFFRRARYDTVQDQIGESVKRYLGTDGRVLPGLSQERVCVVCGSEKRRTLFVKNGFPHVRCEGCSFVYVNPILKEEALREYYADIQGSWAEMTEKAEYNEFQNKYYHFHLDNIEALLTTPNRSILDIGCNNGEFLVVARERGWTVTGHELSRYALERARKKDIEAFDGKLDPSTFGGRRFGAVSLLGVLEHVPYPSELLRVVLGFLEPGGILAVLVPNIESIATRILQEKCNTFDGIEHINFWGRATFARVLQKNGFVEAHSETAISEIYTINNYLQFEHPYACPDEHPLLLDRLTPEYVHEHFLGHHLCVYAKPA